MRKFKIEIFKDEEKKRKMRKCIIIIEKIVYFLSAILLLVLPLIMKIKNIVINNIAINNIHTIAFIFIIIYHFFVCIFIDEFDSLCIVERLFSEDLKLDNSNNFLGNKSREGDAITINIYFFYIIFLIIGYYLKLLMWNLLLAGTIFLLLFNNVFKHDYCLIKKIVYKNKFNCCLGCHIAGWEKVLIFSTIPFMIFINELNIFNICLAIIIISLSVVELLKWEHSLYFRPERFSLLLNNKLRSRCEKCDKRCKECNGNNNIVGPEDIHFKKKGLKLIDKIKEHYVASGLIFSLVLTICEFLLLGKKYFMDYYICMIFLFFEVPAFWVIYKWIEKKLEKIDIHLDEIVTPKDDGDKKVVFKQAIAKTFRITTINNILVYLSSVSFFIGIVLVLYFNDKIILPEYAVVKNSISLGFEVKIRIVAVLMILVISIMIACRAFVVFYNSFIGLAQISTFEVKVDYFSTGYKHYIGIKRFCNMAVTIMVFVCLTAFLAVLNSPINFSDNIKKIIYTLFILVSVCPTVILIGTKYYLHKIQLKMKYKVINKYDEKLKHSKYVYSYNIGDKRILDIEKLLTERDMLLNLNIGEMKIFDNVLSIITVVTGVVQVFLSITELS